MVIVNFSWIDVARDMGVQVISPYTSVEPDGTVISAPILIQKLGATKGMLIFSETESIGSIRDCLADYGYGYSVMSGPFGTMCPERTDLIQIFSDWGWSGSVEHMPEWLLFDEHDRPYESGEGAPTLASLPTIERDRLG